MKMIFLLVCLFFYASSIGQNRRPITFNYSYPVKTNFDSVKLTVENNSSNKTFYYSIALQGYNDSTWIPLLSDINSLGMNEFLALKPIKPKRKAIKYVSKKRILMMYEHYKISKIRFGVMYYTRQDLQSTGDIIYLQPM